MGISNLSTGLSLDRLALDRLEPASSARAVETYSPNKDGEKDSSHKDSANQEGEHEGEEDQFRRPSPEPNSSPEVSTDGNQSVSVEPPHKIDSLA